MKKTLGILCNYKENCGVSSYAGAIVHGFSEHSDYDVKILPLDTSLTNLATRDREACLRKTFKAIAREIEQCDVVNVQFENGLFGNTHGEVLQNLKTILNPEKKFIFTMHTADFFEGSEARGSFIEIGKDLLEFRVRLAIHKLYNMAVNPFMVRFIRLISKKQNVCLIVHTEREARICREIFGFERVFAHPLVFLKKDTAERLRETEDREQFQKHYDLQGNDKVLAIYGFVSRYKGHLAAIRALRLLPPEYKLLIVGGQHPQSLVRQKESDDYFETIYKEIDAAPDISGLKLNLKDVEEISLKDRVKFLGFVPDDEMLMILRNADVSVYSYLETGQSASGPASLGLEVGARMLTSRAHVFTELKRFAPNCFEQFDVGNHFELALKARRMVDTPPSRENPFNQKYNLEENIHFYSSVLEQQFS